ncbi:hypothetical protein Vadar_019092 [Vaccinium darrowii]|uniref:Uncharacterized protein n=1 Tax=Vaccinium darrowii TaxID=229202 RepID=A0ACB7ZLF9_9ERIC|nr:hypothetical protein Vadar_019092 [Vaccinium darrowii]
MIDQLVDATSGYERMSFLDAYRGYHQIAMYEPNQEKTSFISPRGLYYYKVMPFGLRNAGAIYQRLVTKMFKEQLGKTMEVYIDYMVVKSKEKPNHIADLKVTFDILREYKSKFNASKCAFGVSSGKFLGHLVTKRGIEANPYQITALQNLQSPRIMKEVQRLTGMATALNRFISKFSDRCRPFFQLLKKREGYEWGAEQEQAFQKLKAYLSSPPLLSTPEAGERLILYLAVSEHAVSSVLLRIKGIEQAPVYFVSKTLLDTETRYLPLEKLVYALITTSRKLPHYFLQHPITVFTEYPLRALLRKADFSGRISKWSIELSQFDLHYQPRTAIKGQILADFIAKFTPTVAPPPPTLHEKEQSFVPEQPTRKAELDPKEWRLYVDGSACNKGSGARMVLFSPEGLVLEQALRLGFSATNNVAEYKALLAGLRSAIELKVSKLRVFCDS